MDGLVIYIIIGIFAGVLAGMFGIGGGVVIVPALIFLAGFTIVQANGTSLAALLLPVGIFAVFEYYKADLINIRLSALVACGLAIGVIFGSMAALALPTGYLKLFYGIFLLWVSWSFMQPVKLWKKYFSRKIRLVFQSSQTELDSRKFPFYVYLILGVVAGVMSGLFGIGGGLVIVPFLIAFLKFDTKKAVGTSLGALMLPVGLPGVILYFNTGNLHLTDAVPVAIGLLAGAVFGAKITIALPSAVVKRIYSVFLLVISISFIYQGVVASLK